MDKYKILNIKFKVFYPSIRQNKALYYTPKPEPESPQIKDAILFNFTCWRILIYSKVSKLIIHVHSTGSNNTLRVSTKIIFLLSTKSKFRRNSIFRNFRFDIKIGVSISVSISICFFDEIKIPTIFHFNIVENFEFDFDFDFDIGISESEFQFRH
jgi:hypothetical protein